MIVRDFDGLGRSWWHNKNRKVFCDVERIKRNCIAAPGLSHHDLAAKSGDADDSGDIASLMLEACVDDAGYDQLRQISAELLASGLALFHGEPTIPRVGVGPDNQDVLTVCVQVLCYWQFGKLIQVKEPRH